jgi:hypothetical protein
MQRAMTDTSDAFEAIRYVRTKGELDILWDVGKFCNAVFKEMVAATRPGVPGAEHPVTERLHQIPKFRLGHTASCGLWLIALQPEMSGYRRS